MTSRDALLVTYHFPPSDKVGMFRPTKFAKYLPEFGWSPHILTRYQHTYDADTNDYRELVNGFPSVEYCTEWLPVSGVNDDGLRWATKLLPTLIQQVKTNDIDVVYYTGKPFIQFVLAPLVKWYTGVPYILDLRDPWSLSAYWSGTTLSKAYQQFSAVAEQFTFRHAGAVVCATETMTDQYQRAYPQFETKIYTVPNGFDQDDYAGLSPEPLDGFTVTYIGKFSSFRDPNPFLDAFQELVTEYPEAQFIHVGKREEHVVNAVRERELTDNFCCTGYLPREEAMSIVAGSDVGLVITNRKEALTTKVFDYIACDIPILGIGPENGEMRRLVDPFEHGYTCGEATIGQKLRTIFAAQPEHLGEGSNRHRYTRATVTGELVDVFEAVV